MSSWLNVRRLERTPMVLSQEGGEDWSRSVDFFVHSAGTTTLGIVMYQHSISETLKSLEEAGDGKNNFPEGKGADEGVEKSRITAALNNQILRTA